MLELILEVIGIEFWHSIVDRLMDYSVFPDLLAIGVLVAVFRSVLAQNSDPQPRYWLLGWTLILGHFLAQVFNGTTGILHSIILAVSFSMLLAAGTVFISSSYLGNLSFRRRVVSAGLINGFNLIFICCACFDVNQPILYMALSVASLIFGLIAMWSIGKVTPLRPGVYVLFVAARLIQIGVLYRFDAGYTVTWILFDIYLATAVMLINRYRYQRAVEASSMGMKVVIFSFFIWALVFPFSTLLTLFAPSVHVQSEVWNLPKFLVAVGMILVLLERQVHHHEYLALHDELTGLPNRRLFDDRFQQALDRAPRQGKHVALLVIDLDDFKKINDAYGHPAGDFFLKAVASRFQQVIRRADTLARTGGDEFSVVVCDLPSREAAEQVIKSLRQAMTAPVMVRGTAVPIRASMGMAFYAENGETKTALVAHADAAMYRAKKLIHAKDNPQIPDVIGEMVPFPRPWA